MKTLPYKKFYFFYTINILLFFLSGFCLYKCSQYIFYNFSQNKKLYTEILKMSFERNSKVYGVITMFIDKRKLNIANTENNKLIILDYMQRTNNQKYIIYKVDIKKNIIILCTSIFVRLFYLLFLKKYLNKNLICLRAILKPSLCLEEQRKNKIIIHFNGKVYKKRNDVWI